MTATDYIADDHRTYAPSLGGVSRDDAHQAPMTDDPDVDVGLRKARKQFAAGFGLLTAALALGAVFFDDDLVLYAGFTAFVALVSLFADRANASKPPEYLNNYSEFSAHNHTMYDHYNQQIIFAEDSSLKG